MATRRTPLTPDQLRRDPEAQRSNKYLGKTTFIPRPTVPDVMQLDEESRQRFYNDETAWEEAENLRLDNIATQQAHWDAIEARKEAEAKARQEAARMAMLAPAKAQYLADGGSESDWPDIEKRLTDEWRFQRAAAAMRGDDSAVADARALLGMTERAI